MNLKERLLTLNYVRDNEYLNKYVQLVNENSGTVKQKYVTNDHHIVPKQFFNRNKLPVDNSPSNIVTLKAKDHVLAHYYLSLCVLDEYRTGMIEAFMKLLNTKILPNEREVFTKLELYDEIYSRYITNTSERRLNALKGWETRKKNGSFMNNRPTSKHQKEVTSKIFKGIPKSEEQRKKMSESGRKYHQEHPNSNAGTNNPMYGKHHSEETKRKIGEKNNKCGYRWMNNPVIGKETFASPIKVQFYLDKGFVFGKLNRKRKNA